MLYTAITEVLTGNQVLKTMPTIDNFKLLFLSWLLVFYRSGCPRLLGGHYSILYITVKRQN